MDTNTRPIDTRHEAIKALAAALGDMGYTRDSEPGDVTGHDARYATGMMLHEIARQSDWPFAWEFVTEAGGTGKNLMHFIASAMVTPSPVCDETVAAIVLQRARWYGESFIPEALAMLDSASEIERDRHVDEQIDERKAS